ncbi:response regulator [Methanospirillum stamsii]|uniref:Hybrid sensor histidine kinase/response regulator n=1 Tax=Methanospirillum stamsii TaxID=1277351 RepID=A0A2V2N549_9EURY|nr:hybrid sensor histidine kinase/response regulator [Methanospirillum stamsii]PWR75202.1 hybrid sensor histidine kinase/response regulator [Methanospirillum stamsii]
MTGITQPNSAPILIVEDNRTQAEYLRYILEKEGYSVVITSNGHEAISTVRKTRPLLILTDIMMPEMDGYELCSFLKNDPDIADIPVILVTHLFNPVDVIKGLESGADNFIIKPYTPEIIHTRINSILKAENKPNPNDKPTPLHVVFSDRSHVIRATRLQIINILLSTYEVAIKNNSDLQIAQEKLHYLNDQMQKTLSELKKSNDDLSVENHERKMVETALEAANNKLQLMASITRHDLLNQLNSLQGYLELATLDRNENPELAWTYIDKAHVILQQTVSTVKFTKEYQEIGIKSPVWQNCKRLVSKSLQHTSLHHVSLINAIPDSLEIYADPLIEKVFSNLIENAVRYGGKITRILIDYEELSDLKRIICEDDGSGVPEEEKAMIFHYQYGKNTGQGLFLSQEILSITGISIFETGIPGKGARFEIICPDNTIRFDDTT